MKTLTLAPLLVLASSLSPFATSARAENAACPFAGSTATLSQLPGYKALSSVDPVKVLDQLTISESQMIQAAVSESLETDSETQLDAAQAWAVFADVPRFYNGGQIEYFGLDKERFVLVSYYPEGQQQGFVARLKASGSSLRDLRKARFEPIARVRGGELSCVSLADAN